VVPNIVVESNEYFGEEGKKVVFATDKSETPTFMDRFTSYFWLNPDINEDNPYLERSYKLSTTIWTPEMWLFFFICFSVTGSGWMVSNNISQMDKALRYKNVDVTQSALVSIFAFGSGTGRIGIGYLQALTSEKVSRAF